MTSTARRWTTSIAWTVIGAVALVMVTAVLTAAVSSVRANDNTKKLSGQLSAARGQIGGLQADNAALRADNAALQEQVSALNASNQVLRRQNRQMNHQLAALVAYLRESGIEIPSTLVPIGGGSGSSHPKAEPAKPGHSNPPAPGTPGATPAPTAPSADPLCDFLPVACLLT